MKIALTYWRSLLALGVLALLLPTLAACGGQGASPSTTLPTAVIATPDTLPTAAPATSAPATAEATPEPAPTDPTAEPAPTDPTAPPAGGAPEGALRTQHLEAGVVNHLYYTDRERVLTLTKIAGFDWVRQQVVWKDIEGPTPGNYIWDELDNIVNDTAAHGLKLMVSVVRSPSFSVAGYNPTGGLPKDPSAFGDFVEAMAKRYGDKIGAYEIWNEPNLQQENGGRVVPEDAGTYVELLVESYNRIKAVSPAAYVLAAAPSSTGVTDPAVAVADEEYYRAMYRYNGGIIKNHFDAQAVHPGGSANPPDTLWPDNPSTADGWTTDPTFYFRHVENVRRFMEEEGVADHQIWITEFGWATANNTPGYEFGNQISLEQQRDYIIGAIKRAYEEYRDEQGRPWVGVMFLWNMNFAVLWGQQGNPDHEQASFGILNPDYSPRPAFIGLQGYLAEMKAEQGR